MTALSPRRLPLSLSMPVTLYHPFADAIDRGIEVGFLPMESADAVWLPKQRAIVLTSCNDSPVWRRCAAAYTLAYIELSTTLRARAQRAGLIPSRSLYTRMHRRASRRLIPFGLLRDALQASVDASVVAHALGVTVRVLADRITHLRSHERVYVADFVRDLEWGDVVERRPFTIVHEGVKVREFCPMPIAWTVTAISSVATVAHTLGVF